MKQPQPNTLIIIGIFALLLTGCSTNSNYKTDSSNSDLIVYSNCEDKVICYHHSSGYAGSGSCFRDADLVLKYCNGVTK